MTLRSKPNRLYLYLLRPEGDRGAYQWIASANGFLPSLWRILLADAKPAPQLQQLLPDDVSTWIASDARVALERFADFQQLVLRHPRVDQVSGLRRYLAATKRFLEESIAGWEKAGYAAPCFSTNLSQLPASDPSITVLPDHLFELGQFREALQRIISNDEVLAIDDVMGFPERNLRFDDWKAWSGMFGLAQLEPDYFSSAFRRPFDCDYSDHDYDELGSDADLGADCHRYRIGDRWGVRCLDREVLAPEWDRVLKSGVQSLVWIQRDSLFGLASVAGTDAGRILRNPDLNETHPFVDGFARARSGDGMGLLTVEGSWHLVPCVDEIYCFAHERAVIRVRGLYGFIDTAATIVVDPMYDEADDFTSSGVARVRKGEQCGLIRSDGSLALPLQFSAVEWSEAFAGWSCQRDGVWTLAHADGSKWIDGGWDAIEVFVHGHLIRVRRGEQVGLLRWNGETLLDCEFDELHPCNLAIIARKQGMAGMIGSDGSQLIPFEFAYIDAVESHFEGEQRLVTPQLMRVLSPPGRAAPRIGIWDIERRRCIVPCAHDFVWTSLLGIGNVYGFIVGNRNPKRGFSSKGRYRVGVLNAEGSVLVPQEYAWIGEVTPLNRDDAMADIRSTIYHYWSRGEPVRAAIDEHGPLVGLPPPDLSDARTAVAAGR